MKMKMFLFALPCSALLILGASSPIAFADGLPCLACAKGSRGQIIFIGGIDITSAGQRTRVQYTLYNPNEEDEYGDILITDIRVFDPDGNELALNPDPLPDLESIGDQFPKILPARNSTIVLFDELVSEPTIPPDRTIRSQVLFTWESASNKKVLPLKIVGLEFRAEFNHGAIGRTSQSGRNTTHPHLILELKDRDDDDDDDDRGRHKDRDDDDDDDDDEDDDD